METFNNFRFNPRPYENQLSEFGRKVFNILVQKWRSDQNYTQISQHTYQQQRNSSHNRQKILTYNEAIRPSPPMICHEINTDIDDNDQPFDFNVDLNLRHRDMNIPSISEMIQSRDTSHQSLKLVALDKDIASEDANTCSNDLLSPVMEGHPDMNNGILNINDLPQSRVSSDNDNTNLTKDVDWENMFDTDLITTESAIANAQLVLKQIEANPVNNFYITNEPRDNKKKCETKRKKKSDETNNNDNKINKIMKRKNQLITDVIPKKVKKVPDEPKISFRKQKYTKTVKNWLNDIEPNNEKEIIEDEDKNEKRQSADIIIEKAKKKSNKKVIQAQLANKDGIMKFRKPETESMKKFDSEEAMALDENDVAKKLKTPEKNETEKANKDKTPKENKAEKTIKNKPKFLAPIKSQIPVQDVKFQVTSLHKENVDDHVPLLSQIENEELILVLIYSNGFCQLNHHHTDDTCKPEGFIISFEEHFFYFKGAHEKYKEILRPLLERNKIICYGGKSVLKYVKSEFDLDIYTINVIDTEIGGSILDPDNPPENFSDLQKLLSFVPQFTIATECLLQKTAWYTSLLKECASNLINLLIEEQLWDVFTNIEMKLLPIIAEMEIRGVSIDTQKLKSMEDILLTKMKSTELECHKAAGKSFQINSPVQVRALIYDELKLDAKCNMKIRETLAQGAKSTSELMLRGLVSVHALPRLILEYRHLHKAHATFLAGIAQHVKDGIVKPTWVQTAAATGRIASNNPNLQAIPKVPFNLVLYPALSEANDATEVGALSFRSVYTSRGGRRLLACDFKHVECRVFAHAAADAPLAAVLRSRRDLFRALAHQWLQKPEQEVTAEDRERTKRIVYASLYGAGVRKLMEILDVGFEQALAVQASFNRTFPSLRSFGQSVVSRCAAEGGRLATLGGRARTFRLIASREPALRAQAERQAVNFVIQGSAADLCKLAMVEASARLRSHSPPLDARLLLQIHDELVWEVRDDHLAPAAVIIKRAMEGCGRRSGMEDALPVAVSVGDNWGEMTEYHVDKE